MTPHTYFGTRGREMGEGKERDVRQAKPRIYLTLFVENGEPGQHFTAYFFINPGRDEDVNGGWRFWVRSGAP